MALSQGFKDVEVWASAATADRTDPDDSALMPPLVVADGWPATFSADAGDTPRRAVFNELYHRETQALVDIRNYGIIPYDADIDTFQGGIKQVAGVAYKALVDNGPTYGNATDPTASGQTVWELLPGAVSIPNAPSAPMATAPQSGELDWFWNCPKDNGAEVTEFDFRWRVAGTTAWNDVTGLTTARTVLTGLTNGQAIEAQVRARNSAGNSAYSSTGSATPSGTVPEGGATLALRATSGDGEVDLDWLEPDDGGVAITSYIVQWREDGQGFSTSRQASVTTTEHTVTPLTNGTEYFFRVRAVNGEGSGVFSNEASATPEAVVVPPTPPADTAPAAPGTPTGTARRVLTIDWTWDLVTDDGGQPVTGYDFQWRVAGASWSGNVTRVSRTSFTTTHANSNAGIQARVRAVNSVGAGGWSSPIGSVSQSDLAGADLPTQVHEFTSSQTWLWPYGDLSRAAIALIGPDLARDSSRDLSLGTGVWSAAVSDGTTLWFVNDVTDTAVAYVAATLARDSSKDISLPSGSSLTCATSDGTTLWFAKGAGVNSAIAYNASTQARDSAKDVGIGSGFFNSAVSDGTTLWFVHNSTSTARAYNASTQARDSAKDIDLGAGDWDSALSDGSTLWLVEEDGNLATGYAAPGSASVSGVTLATADVDQGGLEIRRASGLSENQSVVITVGGSGRVAIYPQL